MRMDLRRRALIESVDKYSLPDWFQETEYIANATSATASMPKLCINTGHICTNNTDIYIKAEYMGNFDGFPIDSRLNNAAQILYSINIYNATGNVYFRYGTKRSGGGTTAVAGIGRISEISIIDGVLTVISGTAQGSIDLSGESFSTSSPLYLFARFDGNYAARMRLHEFMLWENKKLAVWGATGYNKENTSQVGVFDRVNQQFILPEGTGTMYKGGDV